MGRRLHSVSRGLTQTRISGCRVHFHSDRVASNRCSRVHSGSRGFTLAGLGASGVIRDRLGSLNTPRGCRGYSGSLGFNRASISVACFIRVRLGSLRRA